MESRLLGLSCPKYKALGPVKGAIGEPEILEKNNSPHELVTPNDLVSEPLCQASVSVT